MATPITAIVTAYQRVEQTLVTLRELLNCRPAPAEILVHVDGNQIECATAIRRAFSTIRVIESEANLGPGGGRNKLIAAATHPIVASFDDDSYPIDSDYFGRLATLFARFPDADIICAHVYLPGDLIKAARKQAWWVADFIGNACAYRRESFLQAGGYVPIPIAYDMEEVDLALRLHANGRRILLTPELRVLHDTDLARHAAPVVTARSLANIALLAYLRYPISLWPVGLGQYLNRLRWLLAHDRRAGTLQSFLIIPRHVARYRHYRQVLPSASIRSYLALRRHPVAACI
jgi:GT2 family glycosyltransferase